MHPTVERLIGRLLRPLRAGEEKLAWNDPRLKRAPDSIILTSSAFKDGSSIPERFAGEGVGDNISPPLAWSGLPEDVRDLVIIVQDQDSPTLRPIVHLIATGIPAKAGNLPEGALNFPGTGVQLGAGSFEKVGYAGPRPLRGHGPHHYVFQIFALSERMVLPKTPDLSLVLSRLGRSIIARGRLTGIYEQDR